MFFRRLNDTDLAAEYALFNQEAADLLAYYGPAALTLPTYQRIERILSDITAEQQRRADLAARRLAA
jgi:hypothetical protein